MNFYIAIFFLAIFGSSSAAVTFDGGCPDVNVVTFFNATAYLGTWYEYARYYTNYEDGSCISAQYSATEDGSVTVVNSQTYTATGIIATITGSATLDDPDSGLAKLTVKFPMSTEGAPYWVLGTDYDNYAVPWTCVEFTDAEGAVYSNRSVFIITRERLPSSEVVAAAFSVLNHSDIDTSILVYDDQSNC